MDYRNERDALRGRVESLEQELSEAKRELGEARRREGEAAAEGSRAEAEQLQRLEAAMPEAEALIQRLRRDLGAVERMQAERRTAERKPEQRTDGDASEPKPAPAPPKPWPRPVVALGALGLVGAMVYGLVHAQRSHVRHQAACNEAAACCLRYHEPGDPFCNWVG